MDQGRICPDEAIIEQFVFGRATPERASWMEEHAAACSSCRKLVATLIQLSMSSPSSALAPLRASAAPLDPGVEVGRYQIRERIGVGGMGVVLSAYDPELQRPVAVKLMHPFLGDPAARWLRVTREAQLMARLSHPHVCAVYDVGLFEGQVYLVMELVQGRTLGRWLDSAAHTWREIRDAYVAAGRGLAAAHAMGIVHSDFKPDNVLVGDDGRIRVTDFGLARTLEDSRAGVCGGTPAYMAPELQGGNASTPSSDQYAFCVALRAALADLRPPSWMVRALARGLSEEPSQRHPSMDALLASLTRDQRQRVPLIAGALLVGLAAVAVALVVSRETHIEPEQVCRATSHELDGAWDSTRRGELASSFGASRAPFAGTLFTTVAARLDAWAARWRELRRDACLANLQGRESSTLMDVRVLCLAERRDELRAVVELLARPREPTLTRAVELAYGLAPLDGCAHPTLAFLQQAPRDPDGWARHQELSADLARIKTLNNAAEYTEARDLATKVVAGARVLGPSRLLASALHLQAVVQTALGDAAPAETTLREAGRVAEASRADDVVVSVRLARLRLISGIRARYQELDELRADAEAAINRMGRSELDEASLLSTVGTIHVMAQAYQLAQDSLTAAAEVQARRLGDSPELARTLNALGAMQVSLGHLDEGAATLERALAIDLRLYGDAHPSTAATRINLAAVAADRHRFAEAVDVYRKALPAIERSRGENHPHVADALGELALALSALHRDDEAIASATRALRIRQHLEAKPHRETARAWDDLGLMNLNAKRWQPARAALDQSAAMWRALGDAASLGYADNQINLGALWIGLGDHGQAIACHRRAHTLYAKSLGPHHPRTVKLVSQLGADELLRGSTASAISLLEQAIAIQRGSDGGPAPDVPATDLATTELTLARALVERGRPRDRERALALVDAARSLLRAAGDSGMDALAELERWVAQPGKRLTPDAD